MIPIAVRIKATPKAQSLFNQYLHSADRQCPITAWMKGDREAMLFIGELVIEDVGPFVGVTTLEEEKAYTEKYLVDHPLNNGARERLATVKSRLGKDRANDN